LSNWQPGVTYQPRPCSQILSSIALGFLDVEEAELSVHFAQAEMALARSMGLEGKSLPYLMEGLHMLGKLKEAEQHM
jgi:hypothetical protein